MKIRNLCALLLALMLLALASCGKKEDHPQPEDPNVTQEEGAVPVHLVCSNGSITLRFSLEEGHWLWADDKTFPLDESYALALLETVQGIESLPPVTTAAQLADYGLDSPTKYGHRQQGRVRHLSPGQRVRRQRVCIPGGGRGHGVCRAGPAGSDRPQHL